MNTKEQLIGLYTVIRRELIRMFRIFSQVFIPPVITTFLYFLIFGAIIGSRIGPVSGVSYTMFIAPGLIMMAVITNAYANVSSSFYSIRFQKNVEEMLVSPMHYSLIMLGFCIGGVLRATIVAILIYLISYCFVDIDFKHLPMTLIIVFLSSSLFSLAGFTNGLLAKSFDDISIVPTFIIAPLTYLGGVFYESTMLSPFWQKVTYFNPVFYMVNALRNAMIGHGEVGMGYALTIIVLMLTALGALNLYLLKTGKGIRE